MKKLFLFLILLVLMQNVSAEIGIKQVTTSPDEIIPGDKINLMITLENNGNKDVKDVSIKLDLNNMPFAPIDSSTEQIIGEIENEDSVRINFNLIALPEAEPRIYKIPVKISYNNSIKESLISINIKSNPKLDLILENSEVIKINDNGKVAVKIINLGLSEIKSLRLVLLNNPDYEILSSNIIYINKIDVEDFETAEFTIIPSVKNPKLIFNLGYKDVNNKEYAENKELSLNVYSLEEAKKLGLIKKNYFMQTLIAVLVFLIIIFVYKKIRKKKNAL
jgi:hypothetical protein